MGGSELGTGELQWRVAGAGEGLGIGGRTEKFAVEGGAAVAFWLPCFFFSLIHWLGRGGVPCGRVALCSFPGRVADWVWGQ